jgi:hypothetical protein
MLKNLDGPKYYATKRNPNVEKTHKNFNCWISLVILVWEVIGTYDDTMTQLWIME